MSELPGYARGEASARNFSVKHLPRNFTLLGLFAYRATISNLYGEVCKYYPSCSAYAVAAVQQYGMFRGMAKSLARIGRCHPWAAGGVDDVVPNPKFSAALTRRGFVVSNPGSHKDLKSKKG